MVQENIIIHLDQGVNFIKQGLEAGGTVVVHWYLSLFLILCSNAGVSRSASFVIAYMIREQRMKFEEALAFVQNKRPVVFPNNGFIKQLREYGKMKQDQPMPSTSQKEETKEEMPSTAQKEDQMTDQFLMEASLP
jgi:dual specificity phosphatase 12